MGKELPLIATNDVVPRFGAPRTQTPNVAVVYATKEGTLECFGRPLRLAESVLSRFIHRYDVDISDRTCSVNLTQKSLPANGDAFFFDATLWYGYRVSDPAAIVKRNVVYGNRLVLDHLLNVIRPIARQFDIERAANAETTINRALATGRSLPEGLVVYQAGINVVPDAAARDYLSKMKGQIWSGHLAVGQRAGEVEAAYHNTQIQEIGARGAAQVEAIKLDVYSERTLDERGLIAVLLAQNPQNSDRVLELVQRWHADREARQDSRELADRKFAQYLLDKKFVRGSHSVALQAFVDRVAGSATPAPLTGTVSGPSRAQLPLAPLPPATPAIGPAPGQRDVITMPTPAPVAPESPTGTARASIPVSAPTVTPGAPAGSTPPSTASATTSTRSASASASRPPETSAPVPSSALTLPRSTTWVAPAPAKPAPQAPTASAQATSGQGPPARVDPPLTSAVDAQPRSVVQPVYFVVDGYATAAPWVARTSAHLSDLWATLRGRADVAVWLRVCVLVHGDGVRVAQPLSQIEAVSDASWLTAAGSPSLGAAFADLATRLPADVGELKASGFAVNRPLVLVVVSGPVGDDWQTAHARLVDRSVLATAPNIAAFGVGVADLATVNALASRPDFAFAAGGEVDEVEGLDRVWAALTDSVVSLGQSLVNGKAVVSIRRPEGFRCAADVT